MKRESVEVARAKYRRDTRRLQTFREVADDWLLWKRGVAQRASEGKVRCT